MGTQLLGNAELKKAVVGVGALRIVIFLGVGVNTRIAV
jgi:hypothetical protein